MSLDSFRINRSYGEHEVLPELLDDIVPEGYYWNKTPKRGEKWVRMARSFILRSERLVPDRFNQAAHEAGDEMGITAEAVKSALTRETFGEGVGVEVPREVLRRVDQRVQEREDISVEDILQVFREGEDSRD